MTGWRPIETAPMDGTPVLLVFKGWSWPIVAAWGCVNSEGLEAWVSSQRAETGENSGPVGVATHWMPLDAMPEGRDDG